MRHVARYGSFNPLTVPTLSAWYDFSNAGTLFTDTGRTTPVVNNGDVIKGVTDLSGLGNHLSEATNGPAYTVGLLNGKSGARFDGVNDILSGAFTPTNITTATIFVVLMWNGNNRGALGLGNGVVNTGYQIRRDAAPVFTVKEFDGAQRSAGSNLADTVYGIISEYHANGNLTAYVNGVPGATNAGAGVGVTATSALKVGALENGTTFPMLGDILEILICSSALSSANHNAMGNYLGTKYAKAWTAVA